MKFIMKKLGKFIFNACFVVGVAMAVGMTAIVTSNIVARYFFNYALSWAEEVARYMMIWLVMLGAAMGVREGIHFRMEMVEHWVGPKLKTMLSLATQVVFGIIGFLLVWQGIILVKLTNFQYATATQMPMSWVYVSLPVSGFLMIFFVIERWISVYRNNY